MNEAHPPEPDRELPLRIATPLPRPEILGLVAHDLRGLVAAEDVDGLELARLASLVEAAAQLDRAPAEDPATGASAPLPELLDSALEGLSWVIRRRSLRVRPVFPEQMELPLFPFRAGLDAALRLALHVALDRAPEDSRLDVELGPGGDSLTTTLAPLEELRRTRVHEASLRLAAELLARDGGSLRLLEAPTPGAWRLTLRPAEAREGSAPLPPASPRPERPPSASSLRRLLVVDDNRDAARTLSLSLGLSGFDCEVVHDGPAALEAVEARSFDAVLLDLGLPGIDGFEVARRIRSMPDRELMLVAVSGYGDADSREKARAAGFDHHFVKPVDEPSLVETLGGPGATD